MRNKEEEVWTFITNFPDYLISNLGRVKTPSKLDTIGRFIKGRITRGCRSRKNKPIYLSIILRKGYHKEKHHVHRLVLENFVGDCPKDHECRHIDGNSENNRLDNLAWGTHKDNMHDQLKHKTRPIGENNNKTTLKEVDVIQIRQLYRHREKGRNCCSLALQFNVTPQTIWNVVYRKTWDHVQ